ncbi:MAG: hypothetical protein WA655_15705 [Candidatus Korobacteraceae bacterium]
MEFNFRYRYVDFHTVFIGDPGVRSVEAGAESPGTLYANELATDVGRTCWDRNEPLAVLDHHFPRDGQFPSASAMVLHKAKLIREKFSAHPSDVIWLVSHKEPDFDAFCSLYLARWIIEDPNAPADWQAYGLHPDGCFDPPGALGIDWFDSHFHHVPVELRWAVQLACYAALIDDKRRIFCPRGRGLHSILYAALERGRDYLSQTSGATEFFDEVRTALREKQLNPVCDSVLEDSRTFAPELALLDRESAAYLRDYERARKAIVYLPESEAPFPNFFKSVKDVSPAKAHGRPPNPTVEHPTLSDTFRIPSDGIYLRDPECLLFQEWARLDLENSALGTGFEFTAIANSQGRPASAVNKTDYIFSIDPERADGRHLYTVWSRLQTMEVEALRASGALAAAESVPGGSEQRSGASSRLFTDPWFDGHNYFGTVVATPHRGTFIGEPGVRRDLRDDPVVEAVRTELENAIYLAASPTEGPRITVSDFSGAAGAADLPARQFDLDSPHLIPAPADTYFRFASIELRADVPIIAGGILRRGLAGQIADSLWQVLHPDLPNEKPAAFERHMVVTSHSVGVWSDRGVAIAYKSASAETGAQVSQYHNDGLREHFAGIVALAREIEQFAANANSTRSQESLANSADMSTRLPAKGDLARQALGIQHTLALPHAEILRRFGDAIGLSQLLSELSSLSRSVNEQLLCEKLVAQNAGLEKRVEEAAELQSKLGWLEVVAVGFYATAMLALGASLLSSQGRTWGTPAALLGGLVCLLVAASIRKPWTQPPGTKARTACAWILIVILLSYIVGLVLWAGLGRGSQG